MRENIIEGVQTYIQSNVEPKRNPVVVVVWREGEAIRQKGGWVVRTIELTFNSVRSREFRENMNISISRRGMGVGSPGSSQL
jgi:hypothetical protein